MWIDELPNQLISASPSRRGFFHQVSGGIYGAALAWLLGQDSPAFASTEQYTDLKPRQPHFRPKAKSVIHLFMNGGPSQMDLFDPKPMLDKHHGEAHVQKIA